jgi:hypothetical protein
METGPGRARRRLGIGGGVALAIAGLGLLASSVGQVTAGEAPVALTFVPIIADPAGCTVPPRDVPALIGTPLPASASSPTAPATPTPFATPAGESADASTRDEIEETVTMAIACANASDLPRQLALFSDRYVKSRFVGPGAWTMDDYELFIATPAVVATPGARLGLISITNVVRLPDGRVGAEVFTGNGFTFYRDYLFFAQERGRWLIDGSAPLDNTSAFAP